LFLVSGFYPTCDGLSIYSGLAVEPSRLVLAGYCLDFCSDLKGLCTLTTADIQGIILGATQSAPIPASI
jgi:hypothetical protein